MHSCLGTLAVTYKAVSMSLSNPLFLPWQQVPRVHYLRCPEVFSFIYLKLNLSLFAIECPLFFCYRIWRMTVLRPAYPLPSRFLNPQPTPPPQPFQPLTGRQHHSLPTLCVCILSRGTGPSVSPEDWISLPVDLTQASPVPMLPVLPSSGCS